MIKSKRKYDIVEGGNGLMYTLLHSHSNMYDMKYKYNKTYELEYIKSDTVVAEYIYKYNKVYMNELLKNYPYLHDYILQHEVNHINANTLSNLYNDISMLCNIKVQYELTKFMMKHNIKNNIPIKYDPTENVLFVNYIGILIYVIVFIITVIGLKYWFNI